MGAANFSALKPTFDSMGVTMVGIGVEKLGYEEFVAGGFWKGDHLLVDTNKDTYRALSCVQNSWRNLWGLLDGEIGRLFKITKKKGMDMNFKGDKNQMGGTFVLGPRDGSLMYGHYQTSTSFEPSMTQVLQSLGIEVPDDYNPYAASQPVLKRDARTKPDFKL